MGDIEVDNLDIRLAMVNFCLKLLYETDDPAAPDAIKHYEEQKQRIEDKIKEKNKPEDIVVGLKPAVLFGKPKQ